MWNASGTGVSRSPSIAFTGFQYENVCTDLAGEFGDYGCADVGLSFTDFFSGSGAAFVLVGTKALIVEVFLFLTALIFGFALFLNFRVVMFR